MKIDICIATKNSIKTLPKLLNKISENNERQNYRILVADGNSDDNTIDFIKQNSTYFIGFATNKEIDKVNILQATNLSMKRSYEKFKLRNCLVKIDGTQTFELTKKTIFIKGGDSKSLSIAAASIIAKNWRDNLMLNYSKIYPQYSWDKNKGYGTKKHKEAIIKYGITDFHRLSFLKKFKLLIEAERC